MTRLVREDVVCIEGGLPALDDRLRSVTGRPLRDLAAEAAGRETGAITERSFAIVPMTCGLGRIDGFAEAVAGIVRHIGGNAWVTDGSDACGLAEAYEGGADGVFLADDRRFVVVDTSARRVFDNAEATAAGFVHALELAGDGVAERGVLVVGAGPVGASAIRLLRARGAIVLLSELDPARAVVPGATPIGLREGLKAADMVLNASPARMEAGWIGRGAIISSPGMPYTFDNEAEKRATIIHDPLPTGVAVMAYLASSDITMTK